MPRKIEFHVALKLFRVHIRRCQFPPNYYTKEAKSFIVNKLALQLYDPKLYAKEGYKFGP